MAEKIKINPYTEPNIDSSIRPEGERTLEKYGAKVEQYTAFVEKLGNRAENLRTKLEELKALLSNDFGGDESSGQLAENLLNVEERLYEIGQKINVEIEKANKEILEQVNTGVKILEAKVDILSGKEKKKLDWVVQAVKSAMGRIDKKTGLMLVTDGHGNEQQEGVPVNDMMDSLNEIKTSVGKRLDELNKLIRDNNFMDYFRAEKMKGNVSDEFKHGKTSKYKSSKEAAEAWINVQIQQFDIITSVVTDLQKHSKKYFDIRPDMKGEKQHWRTKLEAKLTSLDPRKKGNVDEDYKFAMDEMSRRRELVLLEKAALKKPEILALPYRQVETPPPGPGGDTEGPGTGTGEGPGGDTEGPETPPQPPKPPKPEVQLPDSRVFVVDISNIVRRLAEKRTEDKLAEFLRRWRSDSEEGTEVPATPATPESRRGFFSRLFRRSKESAKKTAGDIKNNPKEFASSSWVRLGENGHRRKLLQESIEEIQNNKNLMAEIEARVRKSESAGTHIDKEDVHLELLDSIIKDYTHDVAEAEERGEHVTDEDVQTEVSVLVGEFVTGALNTRQDVESFVNDRIAPIIKRKNLKFSNIDDKDAKGLMYASNLFEIAQNYKRYIDEKLEEWGAEYESPARAILIEHVKNVVKLDINLGLKARDIKETKPVKSLNFLDKFIDASQHAAQKIPVVGKVLASPVTYAAFGSAVGLLMRPFTRSKVGSFITSPIALGALLGSGFAAMRRNRDVKYDRGKVLRDKALRKEAGGPNSRAIENFNYDMWRADDVTSEIDSIINSRPEHINEYDKKFVAEVYARLQLEREAEIDLFSASKAEAEYTGTKIESMRNIKLALRRLNELRPDFRPEALQSQIAVEYNSLVSEVEKQDEGFKKFRRKEVAKTALFAGVAATAIGGVAHGIFGGEHATDAGSSHAHVSGGTISTREHLTPQQIADLNAAGNTVTVHSAMLDGGHTFSPNMHTESLSILDPNVEINLPDGLEMVPDGTTSGLYNIVDSNMSGGQVYAEGIDLSSGTLSMADIHKLQDLGIDVDIQEQVIPGAVSGTSQILIELRNRYNHGVAPTEKLIWHGNVDKAYNTTSLDEPNLQGRIDYHGGNQPPTYEYPATAEDVEMNQIASGSGMTDEHVRVGDNIHGPIFDGREIMSRAGVDSNGIGVFDASRNIKDMLKGGAHAHGGVFDDKFERVRKLFAGRSLKDVAPQFSYRFYANHEDFLAHRAAFSIPLGPDGAIRIDPNTQPDLFKLLFDPETGKPRMTAEIAFSDVDKGVDHIFATNVREDIEAALPRPEEKTTIFNLRPQDVPAKQGFEYNIKTPDVDIEIPNLATEETPVGTVAFAPRKAMEKARKGGRRRLDSGEDVPTPPVKPEKKSKKKEKVPKKERKVKKEDESSGAKIDKKIIDLLAYQDVESFNDEKKKKFAESYKNNPNIRLIAENLAQLESEHSQREVSEVADDIHKRFMDIMNKKGVTPNNISTSKSWVYTEMGKQFYYANLPEDQRKDGFNWGDPVIDQRLQNEILNRQVGRNFWQQWHKNYENRDTLPQATDLLDKVSDDFFVRRDLRKEFERASREVEASGRIDPSNATVEKIGRIIMEANA